MSSVLALLNWVSKWKIAPSAATYALVVDFLLARDHFGMALQVFAEMQSRRITPNLETSQQIIISAARHYPRLAVDLATSFEDNSVRRLDGVAWHSCLASTAEILYVSIVILHRLPRSHRSTEGWRHHVLGRPRSFVKSPSRRRNLHQRATHCRSTWPSGSRNSGARSFENHGDKDSGIPLRPCHRGFLQG
jgi:pentatricopeptide repeat protein